MKPGPLLSRSTRSGDHAEPSTVRRIPGVEIAVGVATLLALYDVLAGPAVVVAGLIAVGPCLAATSGRPRAVAAVGAYVVALILLVSGPDQIWWTRQQLLYLIAAVAVTGVSIYIAQRRAGLERHLTAVQEREIEERRAGAEAHRQAAYSRSLLEASADPLVTISADGMIRDVNAATVSATGISRTELIGTDFADYFTDPLQVKQIHREAFAVESVTNYPLTIRHRDGTLTDVLYNATVYRDLEGVPLGVFAAARDITAQKLAEANFRGLLEGAPDAIIVVDGDGVIRIVNAQTENLFGYARAEILDQRIEILLPERLGAHHREVRLHYQAAPEGRPMGKGMDLNGRRRDGSEFPAEISLAPVHTPQGTFVSAAVRDVTLQNRARIESARANQAKSQFLSRMSHELRTPLNAILGFGQLLEMDELRRDQADGVRHILSAGRHLLGLIDEVLDISQVESGEMRLSLEPVFVPDVTDEALGMIRPLAENHRVGVTAEADGLQVHVLADRQRFKQVIVNLLANAVKYSRTGGHVSIVGSVPEPGLFRLTVSDNGIGIAEEDLGRLFQPFERLNADQSAVPGTGLGLALTRQLMTVMHGAVGVSSRLGDGSSFYVQLPLATAPSPGKSDEFPELSEPAGVTMGRSMTVLYVEDNMSNVRLVEHVFARRPEVSLMVAMQGRLALALAAEHLPELVLLDLHLPDISGEEVLRCLKADSRTMAIPVVMLSADATLGRLERLVTTGGAANFLTKPFEVSRLLAVVDAVAAEWSPSTSR